MRSPLKSQPLSTGEVSTTATVIVGLTGGLVALGWDYLNHELAPAAVLGAVTGVLGIAGLTVHLARLARRAARAADSLQQKLDAEKEARDQINARLKIADERLRLALDSNQIGLFEWNVATHHVYYSPGLWAMLGCNPQGMGDTPEVWQALIHPEDVALYQLRLAAQLSGSAPVIESEYRVRTPAGAWRWVNTRAKSVATQADGRPSRIVGTVQDVTARRKTELALQASEAEGRTLSLVAAKTDNLVLIASPSGTIEWANEAFCRVMEYRLNEVVGRNPAHILTGSETDRRTLVRIRRAMTDGRSIVTDIVNYSKSGRKYHLQVEIQPVHGADGKIENFIAVQTDITARVETDRQLRRAKADADRASRAKSDFLAALSHEIRTPMNGVIGTTSLLLESPLSGDQRDFVTTIRTSGEALLTIINDILDFSAIDSGKVQLVRAPFELAVCLEEALDLFALQASSKRIEIGYTITPDVPGIILGDATRLRQVVVNLLHNAVKFTPSGRISVEVRRLSPIPVVSLSPDDCGGGQRTTLEFTVRDTGIGIPPDRLEHLFEAFSQVDSSNSRRYGGTGLGLATCRKLCEFMGGGIRAESTGAGGSAFVFTILTEPDRNLTVSAPDVPGALREGWVLCVEDNPTTQTRLNGIFKRLGVECLTVSTPRQAVIVADNAAHPPALLVVDAGEYESRPPFDALAPIRSPRLVLFPFGQNPPAQPLTVSAYASTSKPLHTSAFIQALEQLFALPSARTAPALPDRSVADEFPLEVLLAEDNGVNQKIALRLLARLGYRAEAVANGLEAVTALENRPYDLILMDVQMPEMDGYEATRQIRARLAPDRQPKIFALTANTLNDDRKQAIAAGMDDYLSKPVKAAEIAAAIRRHFPAGACIQNVTSETPV